MDGVPSCGRVTTPVGSDGVPSPTALIADTLNWYAEAAFSPVRRIQRWEDETLLSSVIQFSRGSGIGPRKQTRWNKTIEIIENKIDIKGQVSILMIHIYNQQLILTVLT